MNFVSPDQRIRRGASATLTAILVDQNGTAADAVGALTVGVTQADGTVVIAAGTATTHGATGVYTVALTAAQTANLGLLTATWTDAGDASVSITFVEIIGGYYFSIAEARGSYTKLADTNKYPDATILTARDEVMDECERICDVSFVPRYRRVVLDGSGSRELVLPNNRIRTVRTVRVYSNTTTYTTFTAAQLAALSYDEDNRVERTDGNIFVEGRGNIAVEYEHGWDRPFPDLKRANLVHLRYQLGTITSGSPDRAEDANARTRLDEPMAFSTGIPFVDAAYERYSMRSRDEEPSGPFPASRRLDFDPEYYSLFHGGPR